MKNVLILHFFLVNLLVSMGLVAQGLGPWERESIDFEGAPITHLYVVDGALFASGWTGLYQKGSDSENWTKLVDLPYASSLVKHKGRYYIAAGLDGIWESQDLTVWSKVSMNGVFRMTSLATDQETLYGTADGAVLRLEESTRTFEQEPLVSQSIHNAYFGHVLLTEEYVIVFGCDFVYYKSKNADEWQRLDFQYQYCGITAEYINGIVYFSSSGDGVFTFTPGEFEVYPLLSDYADDLRHVVSIYTRAGAVYYLFKNGLYSSDDYREEINGNVLTDIIYYNNSFYVSTVADGIWKSTGLIPRQNGEYVLELAVTPSPSNGLIDVHLSHLQAEEYHLEVFDTRGQLVESIHFNNQYQLFEVNYQLEIPMPGEYIVRCTSANSRISQRVIVMK